MGYLPILLNVTGRPCLVIGGGESAETRVRALLEAGAIVTVVSREAGDGIKLQAASGKIRYLAREYRHGDLNGHRLAYVAIRDREIAESAAREARELDIPINVADNPEASTFISPAVIKRGDLQIAISTSGSSPALAQVLRQRLEQQIGAEYRPVLEILRQARVFLRGREVDQSARASILRSLAKALVDSIGSLDSRQIDSVLRVHLHTDMAELGRDAAQNARQKALRAVPFAKSKIPQ